MNRQNRRTMVELLRSNDLVLLSYVTHLLKGDDVDHLVLDGYTSAVEGSIGAIPRRVMVPEEQLDRARRTLDNAGVPVRK